MTKVCELIEQLGGPAKAGRALNRSTQSMLFYRDGVRPFPAELCPLAERLTEGQIACEDLRPDVEWSVVRGGVVQQS